MPAPSGVFAAGKSPPTWLLAEQLANDTSGPVHHHLYPSGGGSAISR